MRVEKRKVDVEKLYYIASDGTEYERKSDCAEHEMSLRRREYIERFKAIPNVANVSVDVDPELSDRWFYVKNDDDLQAIKLELYSDDSAATEFEPDEFPCWIRVLVDEDGYGVIESLEECIGACANYLTFMNSLKSLNL